MSQFPYPILVISVAVGMDDGHNIFELLDAGAVDVIKKPPSGHFKDYLKTDLVQKVKIASGVRVLTRRPISENMSHFTSTDNQRFQVIAIGASTGGPKALHDILSVLPKHFPNSYRCESTYHFWVFERSRSLDEQMLCTEDSNCC
jgi:two-component system chemotaxis response regulator CheB